MAINLWRLCRVPYTSTMSYEGIYNDTEHPVALVAYLLALLHLPRNMGHLMQLTIIIRVQCQVDILMLILGMTMESCSLLNWTFHMQLDMDVL